MTSGIRALLGGIAVGGAVAAGLIGAPTANAYPPCVMENGLPCGGGMDADLPACTTAIDGLIVWVPSIGDISTCKNGNWHEGPYGS